MPHFVNRWTYIFHFQIDKFDSKLAKSIKQKLQKSFDKMSTLISYQNDKRNSYIYFLFDSECVDELMEKLDQQKEDHFDPELFKMFIMAILYVGRGRGDRAFRHEYDTLIAIERVSMPKKVHIFVYRCAHICVPLCTSVHTRF